MRYMYQRTKDRKAHLGSQAEQSHARKKKWGKKGLAPAVRSRERCTAAENSRGADA